jgi:hypothetical protein
VIVRIAGEGQFRIPDSDTARLNELDNATVAAVESGDEHKFRELYEQMLKMIADDGNALDEDELVASDIIMPPRDITLAEAAAEFTGEGLIPD